MNTDKAWKKWGQKDPYYSVLTDSKFRNQNLNQEAKKEFFVSGDEWMQQIYQHIRTFVKAEFAPTLALDFGCGTGRITLALAKMVEKVVGIDISEDMLEEATKNATEHQITNITWCKSDDNLSALQAYKFDFIHTFIVLQHIPVKRVRNIFEQLLKLLTTGGIGVIHLTYAKKKFEKSYGAMPNTIIRQLRNAFKMVKQFLGELLPFQKDPEMQMNMHNLNHLLFLLQNAGVQKFYTEFTDHGGNFGIVLYFQK